MAIDAVCPFFVKNYGLARSKRGEFYRVGCEAGSLHFPSKVAANFILKNCCFADEGYKGCPFYKALDEHYAVKYGEKERSPEDEEDSE